MSFPGFDEVDVYYLSNNFFNLAHELYSILISIGNILVISYILHIIYLIISLLFPCCLCTQCRTSCRRLAGLSCRVCGPILGTLRGSRHSTPPVQTCATFTLSPRRMKQVKFGFNYI